MYLENYVEPVFVGMPSAVQNAMTSLRVAVFLFFQAKAQIR